MIVQTTTLGYYVTNFSRGSCRWIKQGRPLSRVTMREKKYVSGESTVRHSSLVSPHPCNNTCNHRKIKEECSEKNWRTMTRRNVRILLLITITKIGFVLLGREKNRRCSTALCDSVYTRMQMTFSDKRFYHTILSRKMSKNISFQLLRQCNVSSIQMNAFITECFLWKFMNFHSLYVVYSVYKTFWCSISFNNYKKKHDKFILVNFSYFSATVS